MTDDKDGPTAPDTTPDLRERAVRGIDDAQKAFHTVLAASQKALGETEATLDGVAGGVHSLSLRILEATEASAVSIFSHLRDVAAADGVEEIMRLQGAFLKAQMAQLGEQTRLIAEAAGRLAPESPKGRRG